MTSTAARPTVRTASGAVVGVEAPYDTVAFLGIPYAAPPVGANRWQAPRPHEPWGEARDASAYGPTAPQQGYGALGDLIPNVEIPGEDFLNLNVWTPSTEGSAPVMVFIHGGSWVNGSGALPDYAGHAFARDGIVLVTLNYRLGADGFTWFGEGIPNLGLLDQVAALEWVRDEIAAFGGDPNRVTVFGESAGAMSIGVLLAMPSARGLFSRAILESGAAKHAMSPESARLVANRLADLLEVEHSRDGLGSVSSERLIAAQRAIAAEVTAKPRRRLWGDVAANLLPFEPVIDGEILPARPIDALRAGAPADVDILIGANAEEARLLLAPSGRSRKVGGLLAYAIAIRVGLPPLRAVRAYKRDRPDAPPVDLVVDLMTDWIYRKPLTELAEAHPRTHVYEFAWRSPAYDGELGASHIVELPFVFDALDSEGMRMMLGDEPPQQLADRVHAAWIAFATTGDPGWAAYDTQARTVERFDTITRTEHDPRPHARELWSR